LFDLLSSFGRLYSFIKEKDCRREKGILIPAAVIGREYAVKEVGWLLPINKILL
jgi:hypothetical protein